MKIRLVIKGDPVAKRRPRFVRMNGKVRTYDNQGTAKRTIGLDMLHQLRAQGHLKPLQDNLMIEMRFYTRIPRSWSKKRSMEVLGKPDGRRPDLDNYVKMYADIMNKLLYKDDGQITELWCEKRFSDEPRVEIMAYEAEEKTSANED